MDNISNSSKIVSDDDTAFGLSVFCFFLFILIFPCDIYRTEGDLHTRFRLF